MLETQLKYIQFAVMEKVQKPENIHIEEAWIRTLYKWINRLLK